MFLHMPAQHFHVFSQMPLSESEYVDLIQKAHIHNLGLLLNNAHTKYAPDESMKNAKFKRKRKLLWKYNNQYYSKWQNL